MGLCTSKKNAQVAAVGNNIAVVPAAAADTGDEPDTSVAADTDATTNELDTAPAPASAANATTNDTDIPVAAVEAAAAAAEEAPPPEDANSEETNDKWKDEQLRRWSVSWQFTAGPFDVDETIHGPIKLHYQNRVVSVGCGDDCQIKIDGDSEIQSEHGMISFNTDKLLYVNSSEAPTKLDDVEVDPEAGPTSLKNGSKLQIGGTSLVITCYTEFDPTV
jgi:hypothetical protein